MADLDELNQFLVDRDIVHFAAKEVCPVGRESKPGVLLQLAPEKLWANAVHTLLVLEWLRTEAGSPIQILSGYRDPEYNKAVGGEDGSLHMEFNAFDFRHPEWNPLTLAKWLLRHPLADKMGIGLYEKSGFVHVDTRGLIGKRPVPARWDYETKREWWRKR